MPIIFIAAGYYRKRFIGYVLLFVVVALGSRLLIDSGNILDPLTSILYVVPYGLGGYLLKEKKIKWPMYLGVVFTTLIVLSIPQIGVEYLSYLKESSFVLSKDIMTLDSELLTGNFVLQMFRRLIANTMIYWGFGFEVITKLVIAFFALKIFDKYSKRVDYINSIAFFHRTYGNIVTMFFILSLFILIIKPYIIVQSSIVIFITYFSIAGASVFLEWRFIYRTLKRSVLPSYLLLGWVILFVINIYTNLIALLILLSYSVYVTLNGRDNLNRLLKDNIEKLKEIK